MRCSMKKSLKCFSSDNFDWAHLFRSSSHQINPLDCIGLDWSLGSFSCNKSSFALRQSFFQHKDLFWWNFQLDTVLNRSLLQDTNSVSKFFLVLLLPQWLSLSRLLSLSIFSSSFFTFKGQKVIYVLSLPNISITYKKGRRGSVVTHWTTVVRVRVQFSVCWLEFLIRNNNHATSPGCVRRGLLSKFGYSIVTYIISVLPLSQAPLRRASFITVT